MRVIGYLYTSFSCLALGQSDEIDFQAFVKKYRKVYKSPEDYQVAMEAFAQSVKEIEEVRANSTVEHEVGINEHSDMPQEEFNKIMTSMNDQNVANVGDLPAAVDWEAAGALAPVRDLVRLLKKCGCCYAIASVATLESRFKIQSGISKVVPFSVQQIIDCSTSYGNRGCSGGWIDSTNSYARHEGMVKASDYPFTAKNETCKHILVTNPLKQCIKAWEMEIYETYSASEVSMMHAVALGPVPVFVHASVKGLRNYKSGIITAVACGEGNPNHAITIVGYGTSATGMPYWKIMNSWGKSWGVKGFAYIERTGTRIPRGACGILTEDAEYPQFKDTIKSSPCIKR